MYQALCYVFISEMKFHVISFNFNSLELSYTSKLYIMLSPPLFILPVTSLHPSTSSSSTVFLQVGYQTQFSLFERCSPVIGESCALSSILITLGSLCSRAPGAYHNPFLDNCQSHRPQYGSPLHIRGYFPLYGEPQSPTVDLNDELLQ